MNGAVTHYLTWVGEGQTLALLGGLSTDYYAYIGIGDALEDNTYDALEIQHEWGRERGTSTFDDTNRHGILAASFTGFTGTVGIYQAGILNKPTETEIYTTGTIESVSGTALVGVGTGWTTGDISAGDRFILDADLDGALDSEWGTVSSITNDTNIVLSSSYAGTTGTFSPTKTYKIVKVVSEFDPILAYHYVNTTPFQNLTSADTYNVTLEMGFDTTTSDYITNAGLTEAAKILFNYDSPVAFTYVAYGTGTTAFAKTQTALVTEVECKAATKIELTSTAMYNDTLRYTTRFSATTAEKVISEVGVFNLSTAGDMLMRKVISPAITVPSGKIPVIVIDFQISDSESATGD